MMISIMGYDKNHIWRNGDFEVTNDDLKFEEQNMPKFQEVKKQRNFQIPITKDAFNTMKKARSEAFINKINETKNILNTQIHYSSFYKQRLKAHERYTSTMLKRHINQNQDLNHNSKIQLECNPKVQKLNKPKMIKSNLCINYLKISQINSKSTFKPVTEFKQLKITDLGVCLDKPLNLFDIDDVHHNNHTQSSNFHAYKEKSFTPAMTSHSHRPCNPQSISKPSTSPFLSIPSPRPLTHRSLNPTLFHQPKPRTSLNFIPPKPSTFDLSEIKRRLLNLNVNHDLIQTQAISIPPSLQAMLSPSPSVPFQQPAYIRRTKSTRFKTRKRVKREECKKKILFLSGSSLMPKDFSF